VRAAHALHGGAILETAHKIEEVLARGVAFSVAQGFASHAALRLQRRGGVGRQARDVRPGRVARLAEPAEIKHGRQEDDAAQGGAVPFPQLLCEKGPAEAAVALADEEFRHRHAIAGAQPTGDDLAERLDVALDGEEAVGELLARPDPAAVARADRVDEHEVREVEPSFGVRDERRRRRGADDRAVERQPPGAEGAEMQVGRGRAGAAVHGEGDGPGRGIHAG